MKKNNPAIPIMLREAQGTIPKIYARYGRCSCYPQGPNDWFADTNTEFGKEKSESLEGIVWQSGVGDERS